MEPDAECPPAWVWRDWWLAGAVLGATAVELVVRDDMIWRPLGAVLGVAFALTMLWRRTHPLATAVIGFGAFVATDLASTAFSDEPFSLYAGACVLVLAYALFRWGTGRQVAIGFVVLFLAWAVSTATDFTGAVDATGGLLVLLFLAALGMAVRYRHIVGAQQMERVRSDEREMLARELHDTVAHHVTAIAIQAQAGQILARSRDLDGAAESLGVIEHEASRTLAEMRAMVGSLRQADRATPELLAPRGVDDIADLATMDPTGGLRIEFVRSGDLDHLQPPVEAALYRVAQESITNAKRHARDATRVRVNVVGELKSVRLIVSDDGERASSSPSGGYGLVGMAERLSLLGGDLEAGPGPDRGWTVEATIPRSGGGWHDDSGARRRRPADHPGGSDHHPRQPAGSRGYRAGRRRSRGGGARAAAPPRRVPPRHPHATPGRRRGDAPARRTRRGRSNGSRDHHHVRHR